MKAILLLVLIFVCLLRSGYSEQAKDPVVEISDAEFVEEVCRLGSEEFAARESAHEFLVKASERGIPQLQRALRTEQDPEIRHRCRLILAAIEVKLLVAASSQMEHLRKQLILHAGGYDPGVTVNWMQVKGPRAVLIVDPTGSRSYFIPLESGDFLFQCRVTDGADAAFSNKSFSVALSKVAEDTIDLVKERVWGQSRSGVVDSE